MVGKVKVKTIYAEGGLELSRKIENFINSSVSELIDIEYSTCQSGYVTFHYALIVYR